MSSPEGNFVNLLLNGYLNHVLRRIFSHLDIEDIVNFVCLNKAIKSIAQADHRLRELVHFSLFATKRMAENEARLKSGGFESNSEISLKGKNFALALLACKMRCMPVVRRYYKRCDEYGDYDTLLGVCIDAENLEMLDYLIRDCPDESRPFLKTEAFKIAARRSRSMKVVEFLFDKEYIGVGDDFRPIRFAAQHSGQVVQFMVERFGVSLDEEFFDEDELMSIDEKVVSAAERGLHGLAAYLISRPEFKNLELRIDKESILEYIHYSPIEPFWGEFVLSLLKRTSDEMGHTRLMRYFFYWAVKCRDERGFDVVKYLVEEKEFKADSPPAADAFILCYMNNRPVKNDPMLEYLLVTFGTSVNYQDGEGRTALHCLHPNQYSEAKMLIDYGSPVTAQDFRGQTPLHRICNKFFRNVEPDCVLIRMIRLFVQADRDVINIGDNLERTVLHLFCESQREDEYGDLERVHFLPSIAILECLMESGADPNLKDEEGRTPLSMLNNVSFINEKDKVEAVKILLENGAK